MNLTAVDTHHAPTGVDAEGYRALYEHSPDGVLFTVPDGRVLAANAAACQILGRTEAEIRSLGRQGMADRTDERWTRLLEERAETGSARGIARMIRGDGTVIEAEMSTKVFRDADGEERTCTIIRDVTDRALMERELRESRARLAEAERVAKVGSWEWDIVGDRMSWSDGLLQIYGMAGEDFDFTLEGGMEQRVYPDDRQFVNDAIQEAIAQRSSFSIEYRAVRADGRVRTLRGQGEVVVDEGGEPVRVVGVTQDVTEAKLAQEALRSTSMELERRAGELQQLVLSTAPETNPHPYGALTSRQLEILQLVAEGLTSQQIAQRLYLAMPTVKWHVGQILRKTGSATRAEAVAHVFGAKRSRNA